MLTAKDIELLKEHFLTKKEFNFFKQDLITKQEFLDAMQLQNNNILNFKDEIITEIKELRQETDINSSFRNRIEKQDNRITHLESTVFS